VDTWKVSARLSNSKTLLQNVAAAVAAAVGWFERGPSGSCCRETCWWAGLHARPVANVIKLFTAVSYDFYKKLELLSLASLSNQPGAYPRVEHLKGASLG